MSLDIKVGKYCTVVVTTQASTKVIKVILNSILSLAITPRGGGRTLQI